MAENHDESTALEGHAQKHPIVERPDWLWDKTITLMFEDEREQAQKYIEHLESRLSFDQERNIELHECQAENRRLADAIREKDRRLERLADECDAWERTVRDI